MIFTENSSFFPSNQRFYWIGNFTKFLSVITFYITAITFPHRSRSQCGACGDYVCNFYITWELFREINFIVKLYIRSCLHGNVSKHCDTKISCAQCGNYGNLLSLFFGNNFVEITILLTKLLNS